ncbi:hypothetical protein ABIE67_000417 [Streptomyces sp. V4I8]
MAYLVDCAETIDTAWLRDVAMVGVTSGASVPEVLIEQVLYLLAQHGFEDVETVEEHQRFSLPQRLRQLEGYSRAWASASSAPPSNERSHI